MSKVELLIVRHADAGDKYAWQLSGQPDSRRPLSKKGHRQAKLLARRLRFLFEDVGVIATSPYVRTRETAEILKAKAAPQAEWLELDELKPGSDAGSVLARILRLSKYGRIVVVGHEPLLGEFLSLILTGGVSTPFAMSKGALALVEFNSNDKNSIKKGQGQLTCMLPPSLLKRIRRRKTKRS